MATTSLTEVVQYLRGAALGRDGAGLTDGKLLERFVNERDQAAFAALVRRHGPMVWGVCRRTLGAHHDAEDAFQATFLVLVRRADTVLPREMLANWLYSVALQTARKARALAARHKTRERQVMDMPEPAATEHRLWSDLRPILDEELGRLPDKYRIAIILCDLEGTTHREAARQHKIPEGTLSGRVKRGRALLAKRLTRRGLAVTSVTLVAALAQQVASAGAPANLVVSTIKAAGLFGAAQTAVSEGISSQAVFLAGAILKAMTLNKAKLVLVLLMGACLVTAAVGLAAKQALKAPDEQSPKLDVAVAPVMQTTPVIDPDKPRVDDLGDPLPEHALRRFGTGRFRHGNQIQGFAITKDGTMIATGGSGEIRLWDAATGRLVRSMLTDGSVLTLGFSGDGRRLVSGAAVDFVKYEVGRLVIWDTTTGKALQTVRYEPAWVRSAALSPDGKTVVMACDDGLLQTMDTESGAVRHRVKGNVAGPNAVAFSPDGKLFAARTDAKTLSILDSATGDKRQVVARTDGALRAVTFSTDGTKVALAWDHGATKKDTVIVYDVANSQILWTVSRDPVHVIVSGIYGLALSPDGQTLATSDCNATLEILDAHTGKSLRQVKDGSQSLHGVAYAADGKTVYTAGSNGLVRARDALSLGARFDPQLHTGGVVDISESFDRQTLATDAGGATVRLWDLASGETRTVLKTSERRVLSVQFLREPDRLVSSGSGGAVHLWDTSTGKELKRFIEPLNNWNARLALSPDGKLLAIGEVEGIRVWDLAAGKLVHKLKGHTGYVVSLSFSPDAIYLASASHAFGADDGASHDDYTVRVWRVATGEELYQRTEHYPDSPVFTADGRGVAFLARGNVVKVVVADFISGVERPSPKWSGVATLAPSPCGAWLATAHADGTIRIRAGDSGNEVLRLQADAGATYRLRWAADGKRLYSAHGNTTAMEWSLAPTLDRSKLTASQAWANLASEDALTAYKARWWFLTAEDPAAELKPWLRPALITTTQEKLKKLVADLDSAEFATREAATKELTKPGAVAEPVLLEALAAKPSLEVGLRIKGILKTMAGGKMSAADYRGLSAVEVLYHSSSPPARQLLQAISQGDRGAHQTRAARAALRRLE
jgi:RNA polymerase sigma factor (sigma-70 family)